MLRQILKSIPKSMCRNLATRKNINMPHAFRYFSSTNTFNKEHLNKLLKHAIKNDNDYMVDSLLARKA